MLDNIRYRIDRFLGLKLQFHWSVLILVYLLANWVGRATISKFPTINIYSAYLSGIIVALLIILSILAHEMGHVLMGRKFGIDCSSIKLFALGGIATPTSGFPSAKSEFFVAIAGPITSLIIGLAAMILAIGSALISDDINILSTSLSFVASINIVLAVFNLIPAFPLDGGRVLRSAIWAAKKDYFIATKYASYTGQFLGGCLIGYGGFEIISYSIVSGIWTALIGFLIMMYARQAGKQQHA